jgi:autotransporter-associated beta strand protein
LNRRAGRVLAGTATLAAGIDNSDTTFSGVISGTGANTLTKEGTGTMTLSGNNTYTGQTMVNDGILLITSNNALGTAAGDTLVNAGASLALSNNITTSEPLDLSGTGFGGGGALINVSGNNAVNGTVLLSANMQVNSDAGTLTINGIISGANDLTKAGPGTLRLTGANTFSGQVAIDEGTLSINSIADGGVASPLGMSGAATPVLLGSAGAEGILLYTGGVGSTDRTFFVNGAGGGRINNTGSALTLNGDIDNNGDPFAMGGTGNMTLNGDLSGAGTFTKDGSGTVSMGAANTLTGTTTVDAGTLHFLAGASAATSDVTVNAGGTLSGFGTIQSLVNSGVFKQGDVSNITIFNVSGTDFTQTATGNFRPKLGAAGVHDQLDVTAGAANLAGTFGPTLFGGFVPPVGTVITDIITTTGGVAGTFDSVQPMKPVLTVIPIYNANSVDLMVVRFLTNPALGLDSAQHGLATSLTLAENQAPTADLIDVLDAISTFDTISEVRNAYNEILPRKLDQLGQTSINTTRLQNGNLSTRMNNLRAGVYPRADMFVDNSQMAWNYQGTYLDVVGIPTEGSQKGWFDKFDDDKKNWGIFANGSALFGDQASSVPAQTGYDYTAVGATLGLDYRVVEELVVGLAGGYNHTDTTVDNNGGKANVNTLTIGPYATVQVGDFYADAYAGYAKNFYDIDRNIIFGTINRTAQGDPNGDQVFSYIGFGYDRHIDDFVTGPIVSLQYTKLWIDGYTESNAGSQDDLPAQRHGDLPA